MPEAAGSPPQVLHKKGVSPGRLMRFVATYGTVMDAEVAKELLDVNGIKAIIADASAYVAGYGLAGGVRLQVANEDFERATGILSEHGAVELPDDVEVASEEGEMPAALPDGAVGDSREQDRLGEVDKRISWVVVVLGVLIGNWLALFLMIAGVGGMAGFGGFWVGSVVGAVVGLAVNGLRPPLGQAAGFWAACYGFLMRRMHAPR